MIPGRGELPLRHWPATEDRRAVVVAVHGFNDYSRAFDGWAQHASKTGITVYAYDQRGFGANPDAGHWPGTEALVGDLQAMVQAVQRRHPESPVYILGTSMGAAVTITAMAQPDAPAVSGLVLSAPAVWGGESFSLLYRLSLWLAAHTVPWITVTGEGLDITPTDNMGVLRAMNEDPRVIKETRLGVLYGLVQLMDQAIAASDRIWVPTLILYGAHDEVVPREPVCRLTARLAAPHQTAFYTEGYHMLLRDQQAEVVWRDINRWLRQPQRASLQGVPLPCASTPARINGGNPN